MALAVLSQYLPERESSVTDRVCQENCYLSGKFLGIRNSVWGWLPNQGPWPRSRALTSHAAVESRALRGSLSCVAKKRSTTAEGWSSNQRRPPGRSAVHASHGRCASRSGISGRHIHVPSGNVAHPARRPSGIRPTCLPGLNGVGGQDQVLLLTVQSHTTFRIPKILWVTRPTGLGNKGLDGRTRKPVTPL